MVTINNREAVKPEFLDLKPGSWFLFSTVESPVMKLTNTPWNTMWGTAYNCVSLLGELYNVDCAQIVSPVDLVVDVYRKNSEPEEPE